jgi:hypothetical protein
MSHSSEIQRYCLLQSIACMRDRTELQRHLLDIFLISFFIKLEETRNNRCGSCCASWLNFVDMKFIFQKISGSVSMCACDSSNGSCNERTVDPLEGLRTKFQTVLEITFHRDNGPWDAMKMSYPIGKLWNDGCKQLRHTRSQRWHPDH